MWQDETEYGWIIYFVGLLRLLGGETVEHILQLISIPLHWGFTWSSKRKLVTYKWYQNLWPLFVALIFCYYQEWTQVFWSPFEKYHPWKWGNCFTWNSFDIITPSVQDRWLLWRIKTIMFTKISIFTIMPLDVCSFCSGSLRSEQRFLLPTCQVNLAGQRTDPDSKCGKRWFRRFVHRDSDLAGDRERLVHKNNLQFTSFVLAMFWISTYNNVWILFWFQCYADKQIAIALESVVCAYELC